MDELTTTHMIVFLLSIITGLATILFFMVRAHMNRRKLKEDFFQTEIVTINRRLEKGALHLGKVPNLEMDVKNNTKKLHEHDLKLNDHDHILKDHEIIIKGDKYRKVE